ncbi:TLC domain-containing protein 2-like [Oppia nitens]|uniref:TLC domain-containing protein 2-like n=1 Tax=Oppia nitens TaxID=1686743 RepID=UPI0023DAA395|nr:TLC domain-containing protein 2-like [Oppia nitens]
MFDFLQVLYGSVIAVFSAAAIMAINQMFELCPQWYPSCMRQQPLATTCAITSAKVVYKRWKWRNFFISFVHSMVTGIGSLMCALYMPSLLVDVIDCYLEGAYILTSISLGYFVYDLIEMITHLQYKGTKELLVHHILIISCFLLTVTQYKYCGYATIALLIEISNIFLHFRQLLLLSDTPKSSLVYKVNCYTNLVLFIIVRVACLAWLWTTLIWVLPKVPIIAKTIAFTSLIGICTMTYVLFVRIYQSDFGADNRRDLQRNGINNESANAGAEQALLGGGGRKSGQTLEQSNGFSKSTNEKNS